ncbi:MAG: hypothetical protein EOO81_12345, partial [Oxalobacteraceae bacterium]
MVKRAVIFRAHEKGGGSLSIASASRGIEKEGSGLAKASKGNASFRRKLSKHDQVAASTPDLVAQKSAYSVQAAGMHSPPSSTSVGPGSGGNAASVAQSGELFPQSSMHDLYAPIVAIPEEHAECSHPADDASIISSASEVSDHAPSAAAIVRGAALAAQQLTGSERQMEIMRARGIKGLETEGRNALNYRCGNGARDEAAAKLDLEMRVSSQYVSDNSEEEVSDDEDDMALSGDSSDADSDFDSLLEGGDDAFKDMTDQLDTVLDDLGTNAQAVDIELEPLEDVVFPTEETGSESEYDSEDADFDIDDPDRDGARSESQSASSSSSLEGEIIDDNVAAKLANLQNGAKT